MIYRWRLLRIERLLRRARRKTRWTDMDLDDKQAARVALSKAQGQVVDVLKGLL